MSIRSLRSVPSSSSSSSSSPQLPNRRSKSRAPLPFDRPPNTIVPKRTKPSSSTSRSDPNARSSDSSSTLLLSPSTPSPVDSPSSRRQQSDNLPYMVKPTTKVLDYESLLHECLGWEIIPNHFNTQGVKRNTFVSFGEGQGPPPKVLDVSRLFLDAFTRSFLRSYLHACMHCRSVAAPVYGSWSKPKSGSPLILWDWT